MKTSLFLAFTISLLAFVNLVSASETISKKELLSLLSDLTSNENCPLRVEILNNTYGNKYLSIQATNKTSREKVYFSTQDSSHAIPDDEKELGHFFYLEKLGSDTEFVFQKNTYTDTTFGSKLRTFEVFTLVTDSFNDIISIKYKREHEKNGWFTTEVITDEVFSCTI